jgi:hypothetical protein
MVPKRGSHVKQAYKGVERRLFTKVIIGSLLISLESCARKRAGLLFKGPASSKEHSRTKDKAAASWTQHGAEPVFPTNRT